VPPRKEKLAALLSNEIFDFQLLRNKASDCSVDLIDERIFLEDKTSFINDCINI
jgi:hypothetical protein